MICFIIKNKNMGKAIKIDNANFASRGLGQIHWCKYDISYCTLYKYLISPYLITKELSFCIKTLKASEL